MLKELGLDESGKRIYSCTAEDVLVPAERIRQEFKKKDMEELEESIKDKGQLQAGVCRIDKDRKIVLVAGERRLRACGELGVPYEFTLSEETDPRRIKEIELEENIKRVDLTWQERVDAVDAFHLLQQEFHPPSAGRVTGGHTIADTAEALDKSVGLVAEDLELAAFMQLEEVRGAKNKTEAKKIVKRIKEDYERAKMLKEVQAKATREAYEERGEEPPREEEGPTTGPTLEELVELFMPRILTGRMEEELQEFEDNTFQIVIFDPPWGQELDSVGEHGGEKVLFNDSHDSFARNLEGQLRLLYQKMAEHSHLYLFFGIVDHEFVYHILEKVGFQVNRIPIIWHKQGAHRTREPERWPGRSYEPIAFARKGNKRLVRLGAPDVIITPAPSPAIKQSHPSAKHPDVMLDLLKRSAFPGDRVLDPMAGSGMVGVAAEVLRLTHQLDWTLIEEKEEFTRLSIANCVKGYSKIILSASTHIDRCSCGSAGIREVLERIVEAGKPEICPKCEAMITLERARGLLEA